METEEENASKENGWTDTQVHIEANKSWARGLRLVHPSEIPAKLLDVQEKVHSSIVRQWRQAITGDPERRIRDSMSDEQVQTRLKQVDALNFTFGVVLTYLTEYVVLLRPEYFPALFYLVMAVLMIHRFYSYRSTREHCYMLDFCYFVQASTWLQTLLCSCCSSGEDVCAIWFKANFVLSHGPIAIAIVAWQNSLVFHSLDKVTSFAIHIMPGLFQYLLRWEPALRHTCSVGTAEACYESPLTWTDILVVPLLYYLAHQILYIYIHLTYIDKDPTLVTSLRFLVGEKRNPATQLGYWLCDNLGLKKKGEMLDAHDRNTIYIFTIFQFGYVAVCVLPVFLFYDYKWLNTVYLLTLIISAIWKGGTYYIHIFSQRYNNKFDNGNWHKKD